MSVYIVCDGTTYSNIKSVSFTPEYDPTLATLPVCEFEVNVVTSTAPEDFAGKKIDLHEDLGYTNATNTLLAGWYEVAEAEYSEPGVVRIRAQSLLAWLDKRTLGPEYFSAVDFTTFLRRLFTDAPLLDNQPQWMVDEDPPPIVQANGLNVGTVTGYCPEQTARQRLQQLCQAKMLGVKQWGLESADGLYIFMSPDRTYNVFGIVEKAISLDNTFKAQIVKRTERHTGCTITRYINFRTTERTGENWDSVVQQEGWVDSETGLSQDEIRYYFLKDYHEYNDGTGDVIGAVEISGNMLMNGDYSTGIPATYFRSYEVETDVLQIKPDASADEYIWPGYRVWFYLDANTVRKGVVKSCAFTFGRLARARLVIATDMQPVDVSYIDARCRANGETLHERLIAAPEYERVYVYFPQVLTVWDGDKTVTYVRNNSASGLQSTISSASGQTKTLDVAYTRLQGG